MKTKIYIGVLLFLLLSATVLILLRKEQGEEYWGRKANEILSKNFGLSLTNSWKSIKAGGKDRSAFGRTSADYFVLQEGNRKSFYELRSEFESRERQSPPHSQGFRYAPEGLATFRNDSQALTIVDWWHPEEQGIGILATISTNVSHLTWVANIYAFDHTTNALLYIQIIVGQ